MPDGLTLLFHGHQVDALCRTRVALWATKGTIEKKQIASSDPIRICVPNDSTIFARRVIGQSRLGIGNPFGADHFANGVPLSFDFLDRNDGYIVELLHSGTSELKVGGDVRGVKFRERLHTDLTDGMHNVASWSNRLAGWSLWAMIAISGALLTAGVASIVSQRKNDQITTQIAFLLVLLLLALISVIVLFVRNEFRVGVPKRIWTTPVANLGTPTDPASPQVDNRTAEASESV